MDWSYSNSDIGIFSGRIKTGCMDVRFNVNSTINILNKIYCSSDLRIECTVLGNILEEIMKIIKFIQQGEVVQLGIDGKELYIKTANIGSRPMRLGHLEDIKALASTDKITYNGQEVELPERIKQIGKNITLEGIRLSRVYSDKEFYEDILKDYKDMHDEGLLIFIGETDEWD